MKSAFNFKDFSEKKTKLTSTSPKETDFDLWKRFKNGDESAFILIYNYYVNILFQIGIQFTLDESMVKDCLQDFFIEIRQKRQSLSDTDNIRLYLIKGFRRRIFSYLKKKKKMIYREDLSSDSSFPIEIDEEEKLINAQWNSQQLEKLGKSLLTLNTKERELIYYYFFQNLSYQEIATILNFDHVSSARRLLYKSLQKLRNSFLVCIASLCSII